MTSFKGREEECGNFKIKTDSPLEEPRLHERLCSNPEIKKKKRESNQHGHIYHYFIKYFPETSTHL